MKQFKFLIGETDQKHVAIFCDSAEMFDEFLQNRRDNEIFYFIRQPSDIHGINFTHFCFYNFNITEKQWGRTLVEYLIHNGAFPYIVE